MADPKRFPVNPGPMNAPKNLQLAESDRRADLQAVIDTAAVDQGRKEAASAELDHMDTYGYSWPHHTGYPVAEFPYDDDAQAARHPDRTIPAPENYFG